MKEDYSKQMITKTKPNRGNVRLIKRNGSISLRDGGVLHLRLSGNSLKMKKIHKKIKALLKEEGYFFIIQHRLNRSGSHTKSYLLEPIIKK